MQQFSPERQLLSTYIAVNFFTCGKNFVPMTLSQALINELQLEAASTRRMLERIPADKFDWKPHEKSMSLKSLATHVADLAGMAETIMSTEEVDLAAREKKNTLLATTQDLLDRHEDCVTKSIAALTSAKDEDLYKLWTLRNGAHVLFQMPKVAVLRGMCYNHTYHHRGQLSVYLRLLDVKVPGMYGPSADDI